ncbi:MAG TPA: 4'-phosphopantetheinyl transferase superfamily protein [Azospirillaceae bacterium]|nr:4'-phosphopantetheinyl transferase superfamily protein [Azospirillaceae bacterium]
MRASGERDAVTVWVVDAARAAAEALPMLEALLDAEERARMARFRFERDRALHTVARGALRLVLGRTLGLDPRTLAFAAAPGGKPHLAAPTADLRFNLSHTGGRVLVALARGVELGVDVEALDRKVDWRGVGRMVAAPEEMAALEAAPPDRAAAVFFRLWTAKEAYIKALGTGIGHPLRETCFAIADGEELRLVHDRSRPPPPGGWTVRALDAGDGYAACLAHPGPPRPLVVRRLEEWTQHPPGPTVGEAGGTGS